MKRAVVLVILLSTLYETLKFHPAVTTTNSAMKLLKMWCETTAGTIFPKRKIGHLKDGYEANFLVLTGNPLADFANVKTIELRIKQGRILQP